MEWNFTLDLPPAGPALHSYTSLAPGPVLARLGMDRTGPQGPGPGPTNHPLSHVLSLTRNSHAVLGPKYSARSSLNTVAQGESRLAQLTLAPHTSRAGPAR